MSTAFFIAEDLDEGEIENADISYGRGQAVGASPASLHKPYS